VDVENIYLFFITFPWCIFVLGGTMGGKEKYRQHQERRFLKYVRTQTAEKLHLAGGLGRGHIYLVRRPALSPLLSLSILCFDAFVAVYWRKE